MKICQNCGNQNTDAMNFCLQCGTPLPATTDLSGAAAAEVQTAPNGFAAASAPKRGTSVFWVLGGIALVFIFLIVGAVGLIGYGIATSANVAPTPRPIYNPPLNTNKSAAPNIAAGNSNSSVSPTPQISFTPPTAATKSAIFSVSAQSGWQLSDIDVIGGEQFRTTAAGKINLANLQTDVPTVGSGIVKGNSRRLYAQFPVGALLMRTRYADGKTSNIQPVTAPPSIGIWQNYPDEFGKLEFCVNDNAPDANTGLFTVTVAVIEPPKTTK